MPQARAAEPIRDVWQLGGRNAADIECRRTERGTGQDFFGTTLCCFALQTKHIIETLVTRSPPEHDHDQPSSSFRNQSLETNIARIETVVHRVAISKAVFSLRHGQPYHGMRQGESCCRGLRTTPADICQSSCCMAQAATLGVSAKHTFRFCGV